VLLLAIPIGVACGLINGFLVSYVKLASFLTTLGTLFIFTGIAQKVTAGEAQPFDNATLHKLVNDTSLGGLPNIVFWALAALIITSVLAYRTPFGRHIYAIGGNERVAELSGLPVRRAKLLMFALSGLMAGIAGLMLNAEGGGSSPGMGDSFLLNAIAAIVMGGTALSGGSGGPARTLLGVLTISVLSNGMTLTQVDPAYQTMVFGFIVLFAVAVTTRRAEVDSVK
jgi:ribose/xylose/arabinose/galactoside ABC-type transport system permease subunit